MPTRKAKCTICGNKHVPGADCPSGTPDIDTMMAKILSLEAKLNSRADSSSEEEGARAPRRRRKTGKPLVQVPWAFEYVSRPPSAPVPSKDNLTVQEWVSGFLLAMQARQLPTEMFQILHTHMVEMMQDSSVYPWEAVRHLHNEFLSLVEQGRCSWTDSGEITRLRFLHLHAPAPSQPARKKREETKTKEHIEIDALRAAGKKPCAQFQNGSCSSASSHENDLHFCSFCFYARHTRQESHGEDKCIAKMKSKK